MAAIFRMKRWRVRCDPKLGMWASSGTKGTGINRYATGSCDSAMTGVGIAAPALAVAVALMVDEGDEVEGGALPAEDEEG